jgi:hypothetical protein
MTQSVVNGRDLGGEVAEWLATAPKIYLACREARHAWPIDDASMEWKSDNHQGRPVWVREWPCQHNCGVVRIWRRDLRTWENLGSQYVYPPSVDGARSGYLLPVGSGGLSLDDIFRFHMNATNARPARKRRGEKG